MIKQKVEKFCAKSCFNFPKSEQSICTHHVSWVDTSQQLKHHTANHPLPALGRTKQRTGKAREKTRGCRLRHFNMQRREEEKRKKKLTQKKGDKKVTTHHFPQVD